MARKMKISTTMLLVFGLCMLLVAIALSAASILAVRDELRENSPQIKGVLPDGQDSSESILLIPGLHDSEGDLSFSKGC